MLKKGNDSNNVRVSVVLNTCDRGAYLGDTLEGLKQQTYDNFEVIVVNGPSQDNTEEVAKSYNIRYYTAPYNISKSRNVGIKHAAGDIIAFIDDDAVPEPKWLEDIVKAYEDPKVGAAGGLVYNHDGSAFQFCYGMIDKWGYPVLSWEKPFNYNEPHANFYNINIGTNASYRRQPLIEIGGFDEEIEYYHDESDVCVRMINHGYRVAQLDNAYVHHKMAPSSRRNTKKVVTNWDAIVKNSIYFGVTHTKGIAPLYKRLLRPAYKESRKFPAMFKELLKGNYTPWQYVVRNFSLVRSIYRGYKRGFSSKRQMLQDYTYEPKLFKQYKKQEDLKDGQPKDIVLVTQGYPTANTDGISRYNHVLAKELADRGHRVYVVTKSSEEKKNIFYRDKHWVYYHNPSEVRHETTGYGRLDDIAALTKSAYATTKLISQKVSLDLVLAPLWDVEGLALLRHKVAPTVLTLMSPLKKVVETQWYWLDDPSLETVYELEKYCIGAADGVMAISQAIKDTIAEAYDINWQDIEKRIPVSILPLGVDNAFVKENEVAENKKESIDVLFVGRFEKRKGVDLLLSIIPDMLSKNQDLVFHLVGNADIQDENGVKMFKEFTKQYRHEKWFSRIKQYGYVSDKDLADMYTQCDVFIAPSRYESFGIIFIEAMAAGKPVVGTNIGGIPEIIENGVNGYTFTLNDTKDMQDKLQKLVASETLRKKMGNESKRILTEKFSSKGMGDRFMAMLRSLSK